MKHGSLFSGIGGFDLAASWCGWQNVWQVEIDPFCRAVLQKHFPETKRHEDIKSVKELEAVDVISGGFPCQPFSEAGKRRGKIDDRYLWPQMLRVITEIKPTWIVAENVTGIIRMELDNVLVSLEDQGYTAWPIIIPACAIQAIHRRNRLWILAYSESKQNKRQGSTGFQSLTTQLSDGSFYSNSNSPNVQGSIEQKKSNGQSIGTILISEILKTIDGLLSEAVLCRTSDGIPNRVDRTKALGNAIVPQIAYEIFKAIDEIEKYETNHQP